MARLGVRAALIGLMTDLTAAVIIGRAPFADVFDMAKASQTDLLLIQPTGTDAGRWHGRADIAEQWLGRPDGGRLRILAHDQISSKSNSVPACSSVIRASISLSSSSLVSQTQRLSTSS